MNYTKEQIHNIVAEARIAAKIAASEYFKKELGGVDQYACGFAWCDILGVKGNTRIGRYLKEAGLRKSYTGSLQMWNPAQFPCQNVDTLERGAEAAARVFEHYGFKAYAGSRLD